MMLPFNYNIALFVHGLSAFLFGVVAGVLLRLLSGPCEYTTNIGQLFKEFHSLQQTFDLSLQIFLKLIFLIGCFFIPVFLFYHLSNYLSLPRDRWSGLIYLITLGIAWRVSVRL